MSKNTRGLLSANPAIKRHQLCFPKARLALGL